MRAWRVRNPITIPPTRLALIAPLLTSQPQHSSRGGEPLNAESGNAAIVAGLDALPLAAVAIGLFCMVAIIFVATTYDSAS